MEKDLALAELALKWRILTQRELMDCMKEQGRSGNAGRSLGQILIDRGYINEIELGFLIRELSRTLIYKKGPQSEQSVLCESCGAVYPLPASSARAATCERCKTRLTIPGSKRQREESLTRLDLVKRLHEQFRGSGMTLSRARQIVDLLLEEICRALVEQKRVDLRRVGVFTPGYRPPRTARNPRTGEKISVPYRPAIRFKPSRELLDRLRGSRPAKA